MYSDINVMVVIQNKIVLKTENLLPAYYKKITVHESIKLYTFGLSSWINKEIVEFNHKHKTVPPILVLYNDIILESDGVR